MRRLIAVICLLMAACGVDRVIVAAGTTLEDSGVLTRVVAEYESRTGETVSVVGESSLNVFQLGSSGEADLLITHHPNAEDEFLKRGEHLSTEVAFASKFALLAPPGSGLDGLTLADALEAVASSETTFVGRRDGSGTSAYEAQVWRNIGLDPVTEPWYTATGIGMGATLLIASDRGGVVLTELGSYLQAADVVGLVPVDLADDHPNPYRVTLLDERARGLYEWLVSAEGVAAIEQASVDLFGTAVYSATG